MTVAGTILAVATAVVMLPAPAAQAQPVVDGLRFESDTTFRLDPDEERVRVTVEMTLTNERPDQGNTFYYFDQVSVPALAEAENASAEAPGSGALPVDFDEADGSGLSVISIGLPSQLRYGQTQQVQVSYDLPNQPPRSDYLTRVSGGYASFPVFPFGDPGLTSVTVIIPDSYDEITVGDAGLGYDRRDGNVIYTDSDIADPWNYWVAVAARNDGLLEERAVEIGGTSGSLRHWPGDEEWAGFVEGTLDAGVPMLEELTGLSWPSEGELQVIESAAPHAMGFGGWYDSEEHTIQIGDELDAQLILHELSHVWFNRELTTELWILEGLAELYSHQALERIDGQAPEPESLPDDDPGAQPLRSWVQTAASREEQDPYAYTMSWWVFDQIFDEVGAEPMAEVITALDGREIAYRAGPEPEVLDAGVDWRHLLDLLEEVAGSERAVELYESHVLPGDDVERLADRAEARGTYAEFAADSDGWAPPFELRRAMADWEFDEADGLIESSAAVLDVRNEVLAATDGFGLTELPMLKEAYQGAEDINAVKEQADEYAESAETLSDARTMPGGVAGVLSRIGMLGRNVDDELEDAAADLGRGDLDDALDKVAEVEDEIDESTLIGGVLVGEMLVGLGVAWPLRRRHNRHGSAAAPSADQPDILPP
ncbi:hypothetical protein, partial [Phytoactinopolyspora endophytica]|uniref:hypothetical protein n=1 Tax=Phytoactinopolyspora endophytica TaxID=1642495 RepID=UPI0013EDC0F2